MNKFIKISEKVNASGMKKDKRFISIIGLLGKINIDESYEAFVLLCLAYHVDIHELILSHNNYRNGIITEEEFKQVLYCCLS